MVENLLDWIKLVGAILFSISKSVYFFTHILELADNTSKDCDFKNFVFNVFLKFVYHIGEYRIMRFRLN